MNKNIILITFYDLDSFAVHTLHAVLKRSGFNPHSIFFKSLNINSTADPATDVEIATLASLVKEINPLFVGISFRSTFFKLARSVTNEIRKKQGVLIAWGGIHPTIRPAQCMQLADVVCIGEGEGAVVDLASRLSKGEAIDAIPNLWIKNGEKIIKNDLRFLIQDLDSLPFPDFSVDNKYYIEGGRVASLPHAGRRTNYPIMTSRGCPFRCTYCYNNIAQRIHKDKGKYVRRRSVDSVIKELIEGREEFKNLLYVSFLDDLFTFDLHWIERFSEQYKENVHLPFYCHIHPRFVDEAMIALLKDAGCAGMTMGLQTGSEESRHKYFERFETNAQIIASAKILEKYGIKCTYDLIMDNPLETDRHKHETFNLLLGLPKPFELCVHSLTHFPETKLTNLLLEKGMITGSDVEDQRQKSYERWVPALDLERGKEDLFWDNLYYLAQKKYVPQKLLRRLSKSVFLKRYPKLLTFLLRLTSFSIYTIRSGSMLDRTRWFLLTILNKPHVLFKKRSWIFIWSRIKLKLPFLLNPKEQSAIANKSNALTRDAVAIPHKISFIIASVDRDRELQRCIASIEKAHEHNQAIPVEILVVIQKTKQKKEIALRYPAITTFFYMEKVGLSAARNFALERSRGDYFVFLDDEAAVNDDFIDVLSKRVIAYNEVNAFCGRLMDPVRHIPFSVLFYNNNVKKLRRIDYQYFMGSAHVLSREAIKKVGYYDEHFGVGSQYYCGGEETDFFFRLKVAKEEIIYLPDLVFYHPIICASARYVHNYGHAFGAMLTKNFIYDKRYFFVYLFIGFELIAKAYIRLLQKAFLDGKYREKDKQCHYSERLRGFFEGITSFISNTYLARKEEV